MKTKTMYVYIFFFATLLFLEFAFKLMVFGLPGINSGTINMIFFLGIASAILTVFSKVFNPKINKIIFYILLSIITFWYCLEIVFKLIFNTFFCLTLFNLTDQAAQFASDGIKLIFARSYSIVIMFIPLVIAIIFYRKKEFKKASKKALIKALMLLILSSCLYFGSIQINKNNASSVYNLIYKDHNNDLNLEKLGILNATFLDLQRSIFGFDLNIGEDIINPVDPDDIEVDPVYGYNNIDIDFDALIKKTNDNTIVKMHEYFKNDAGTQQNEYTGLYKDKNLIVVMAESFNEIAVREDLTPTLYKLVNESFVFENFYTPINLSTIGGEFQELTGLFADLSMLSQYWRKGTNSFPQGIGTMFKNKGYNTFAYHANNGKFQDRNVYLKSIGIDNFLYKGNGLEKLMDCSKWPQSDLDMVNATFDKLLEETGDTNFLAYYVSVSGHMPYTWPGNAMSRKHRDKVDDLSYSTAAKAYLASQIELDLALESIIEKLTLAGKLEDTVIAVVADHYPYDMNLDVINELSDYKKDGIIEINHSNLIIWNSETETKHVTKVANQLDFMPTIYNLFGLKYDSRLFIGKDILSSEPGLVFFTNNSWISDYGKYFANSGKFEATTNKEVPDNYVKNMNSIVSGKKSMSKLIMQKNYYKIVLGDK